MSAVAERTPQYIRIYAELKRRIDRGELGPGERLRPQRDLSREFGVTLMTLRQAIALLESEGVLEARHGRGTFVVEPRLTYMLGGLRSLSQEMAARGCRVETHVRRAQVARATPTEAAALGAAEIFSLERVRVIDGVPSVLQASALPVELGSRLDIVALSARSLYDAIAEDAGVVITRASETLCGGRLRAHEARLLGLRAGAPAIVTRRTTFAGERPVVFDEARLGERFVVHTERLRDDVKVEYRFRSEEEAP